ncbi:MAG: hypothetical protein ACR2K0_02825, partial [Acidimicrobiales bacterium]
PVVNPPVVNPLVVNPPVVNPPVVNPPVVNPPVVNPPVVNPPVVNPVPEIPTMPVVEGFEKPAAQQLAVTGVSVAVQVLFGLLLLAFGLFLRRKGQTA